MSYDLIDYDPDRDFDAWYTDTSACWVDRALPRRGQILEVGCATGRMTARIVRPGRWITAVTRSAQMLDRAIARELPGVVWIHDDVTKWGEHLAGRFDAAVCTLVLHEADDPARMLETLRAQVRPGGLLVMTVPAPDSLHRLVGGPYSERQTHLDREKRFGVLHMRLLDWWVMVAGQAGWEIMATEQRMMKPYTNTVMETLPVAVLESFARYEGPAGTLYYIEAVAR